MRQHIPYAQTILHSQAAPCTFLNARQVVWFAHTPVLLAGFVRAHALVLPSVLRLTYTPCSDTHTRARTHTHTYTYTCFARRVLKEGAKALVRFYKTLPDDLSALRDVARQEQKETGAEDLGVEQELERFRCVFESVCVCVCVCVCVTAFSALCPAHTSLRDRARMYDSLTALQTPCTCLYEYVWVSKHAGNLVCVCVCVCV